MLRIGMSLLALVCLCSPAYAAPAHFTEVPFTDCEGLICLPVTLDGQKRTFILDTGDVDTYVAEDTAQSLGWTRLPYTGSDGKVVNGISRTAVHAVRLGGLSLDQPMLVLPRKDMGPTSGTPPYDGGIVYTAFKDRILQIDYGRHILRISDVICGAGHSQAQGELKIITFGHSGPPILTGGPFTVNGHAVQAQIDTAYTGTLLVYDAAVEGLGLKSIGAQGTPRLFPYTDGGVSMLGAATGEIGFGRHPLLGDHPTIYFATPGVHQPDGLFETTVGNELFRHCVVTLDLHAMRLAVEPSHGTAA